MDIPAMKLVSNCPQCKQPFADGDLTVLLETRTTRWAHGHCHLCQNKLMAFMMETGGIASSIGMPTDANLEDAQRMIANDPISADELISWHKALQTSDLDWSKALKSIHT